MIGTHLHTRYQLPGCRSVSTASRPLLYQALDSELHLMGFQIVLKQAKNIFASSSEVYVHE